MCNFKEWYGRGQKYYIIRYKFNKELTQDIALCYVLGCVMSYKNVYMEQNKMKDKYFTKTSSCSLDRKVKIYYNSLRRKCENKRNRAHEEPQSLLLEERK